MSPFFPSTASAAASGSCLCFVLRAQVGGLRSIRSPTRSFPDLDPCGRTRSSGPTWRPLRRVLTFLTLVTRTPRTGAPRPVERLYQYLRTEISTLDLQDLHRLIPIQQVTPLQLANHPPVRRRALNGLHRSSVLPDREQCRAISGLPREQHPEKPGLSAEHRQGP